MLRLEGSGIIRKGLFPSGGTGTDGTGMGKRGEGVERIENRTTEIKNSISRVRPGKGIEQAAIPNGNGTRFATFRSQNRINFRGHIFDHPDTARFGVNVPFVESSRLNSDLTDEVVSKKKKIEKPRLKNAIAQN